MKILIIKLVIYYFFIGTLFLIGVITGYLELTIQRKNTGELVKGILKDIFVLSFCLYWPLFMWLLWKGRNDE